MYDNHKESTRKYETDMFSELKASLTLALNAETSKTMATLGASGVSPKQMSMYQDSVERINTYKNR